MPSSRPDHVPAVLAAVRKLKPRSVLDVGVGFGKWGLLFREYLEIVHSEKDPSRYPKTGWRVRIDGVEGFAPYLAPHHDYIYDDVTVGNATEVVPAAGEYDVIFMGDVIEHFAPADGETVIAAAVRQAKLAFVVSTPATFREQGAAVGNEYEIHRSHWTPAEFTRFGDPADWACGVVRGDLLVAIHFGPEAAENVRRAVRKILVGAAPAAPAVAAAPAKSGGKPRKEKRKKRGPKPAPTFAGRARRAWGELVGRPLRRGGSAGRAGRPGRGGGVAPTPAGGVDDHGDAPPLRRAA